MQGRILLVEDNEALNVANRRILRLKGYEVRAVKTLREAREALAVSEPDVLLLDVMLPDGDGFDFCKEIREETAAHIIFLSARADQADRVRGLLGGGDDYITKPFHPDELIARIAAAMRRRQMERDARRQDHILTLGMLSADKLNDTVYVNDQELVLTVKEYLLLLALIKAKGDVVLKDILYQEVWKQGMNKDENALWKLVSRVKKKLLDASDGRITIYTARGVGYRLDVNTEE